MASLPAFDLNITLGAFQIGVLISYALFGVTTAQVYIYHRQDFTEDSRKLKYLVTFVWLCEVAHAVCIGATLYEQTVSDYGHPERLVLMPLVFTLAFLFSGAVGVCVQGFSSLRIYRLTKSSYISVFTVILEFLRVAFTVMAVVYGSQRNLTVTSYDSRAAWVLYANWVVSAVNDLVIATTLVWWFHQQRAIVTNALLDKLIKWTIETGVVTSAATSLSLVLFITMKKGCRWIHIDWMYINLPDLSRR
ncbi:hypothetical protein C8R44DRAFT_876699 [Mycena epipterygia]|nr:hypothetical protein C8R44DRAFT_876699 [Mycena epipterygia]